jgi:hypothetical protein
MVHADADEAVVGGEVVNAVRDRLADRIRREVVDVHPVGLALRLPLTSCVLEVAYQFLLLGVDRDDRHAPLDAVLGLRVDGDVFPREFDGVVEPARRWVSAEI